MDARSIEASLLKARESSCKVGRFTFTVRRPTQMEETLRAERHKGSQVAIALECVSEDVIDWQVKECDIKKDGADVAVPFDRNLYRAWIADQVNLWLPIRTHVLEQIAANERQIEKLQGN